MKKNTLFILTLLLSASVGAKAQQITNGSFENWTTTGPYQEPDSWISVNSLTDNYPTYGTLRTTDAYDGTYALKLVSGRFDLTPGGWPIVDTGAIAIFGPLPTGNNPPDGVSFAFHPTKLSFYYKFSPGTIPAGVIDTARVYVDFRKLGNVIGIGVFKVYGAAVNSYTNYQMTINWFSTDVPDSMRLDITSGITSINFNSSSNPCNNQIGNTLYIDKLEFIYSAGINENAEIARFALYPNPADEMVTIDAGDNKIQRLNIYSLLGEIVYSAETQGSKTSIDIAGFAKGIYTVEVMAGNKVAIKKLVVQ